MRFINKKILFLVFALVSCGQTGRKTNGEELTKSRQYRVAIELILKKEEVKDYLVNLLKKTPMELYAWKNHVVLFGNAEDTSGVEGIIDLADEAIDIKRYNSPMYIFDKSCHCQDTAVQKPWKNYLLTANLVEDSVLQNEYMCYHEKQFEEWPEVAQGFCRAGFQQLLVYRNRRQLLLVISIPAGKSLDELNPKTVENNPRMEEWNSIMGKYQEGIEGTNPGDTWVFLDKL